MNNHNLAIHELDELYNIFVEISKDINFNVEKTDQHQLSNLRFKSNTLILTLSKNLSFVGLYILR